MSIKKKVLIIDDQTGIRRLLVEVLGAAGYIIAEAPNGYEGSQIFESFDPDIVLLDMKMPRMDGLETLRFIRSKDQNVPVILMTAYGEKEAIEEAKRLGIATNLIKPFDINKMKELIATLILEDRRETNSEVAVTQE